MATVTMQQAQAPSTSFLTRQRLPASEIRIIDPARETRIALAFAVFYIAAAFVTGLVERAWPAPILGATALTSDATYALGFKIGLLLIVPAIAIRRAGYTMDDLLLGWRPTPAAVAKLLVLFALGLLINASKLGPIRDAVDTLPPFEAMLRVTIGCLLVLFGAGIPEELVYRWGLQTRLERSWGRPAAIVVTALVFTAWHLPPRYFNAEGAEGTAGDLGSVLLGTGLPVLLVAFILGWAWDRWRNLPALMILHWGVDTLPSVASLLKIPVGSH
ncbi:MAG TPA: CPBP family intramembrane glutamic endopeptidase [Gemmatimonadota bacterium]|nr:CPBP family intramembrane glutamic endopeptidase [Gemmatimonadota bacterium]